MEPEIKSKKRVALYIRVSTDEQGDMYGPKLQKEALMGLIKSKGHDLEFAGKDYVYIDNGVSGSTEYLDRMEFKRMMEDMTMLDNKPFDAVAVYKIDRFARRLKVLLDIIDLFEENDIEFLSAKESIDTSTPFGKAMLGIVGVIAELELETIKMRTQEGIQRSKESGSYPGIPPVGYIKDRDKKVIIQKEEAEVVKNIFDMFVYQSMSINQIANYLTLHKTPSPIHFRHLHNKEIKKRKLSKAGIYHWDPSAVKHILQNELYIGNQYYNKSKDGKKLPQKEWSLYPHDERIIDTKLFLQTQNLLSNKNRSYKSTLPGQRKNLLQGLIKCANCYDPETGEQPYSWHGTPKKVKSTGKNKYYYQCSTKNANKSKLRKVECKTIPLSAELMENHVVDFIYKLIDNPKVVFKHQQNLQSKKSEVQNLKRRYKNLLKLIRSYPSNKSNIVEMKENNLINMKQATKRAEKLDNAQKSYIKEKIDLENSLSIFTSTKEYIKSFEAFKEVYKDWFTKSKKKNTTDNLYRLIHMIVDEIIVFSRPKRKTDVVSGRKVEGQMIPYKLKIALRIPSEMLGDLLSSVSNDPKFEAKMDEWWAV